MKFRSLVHTYVNHRHYLKVQPTPHPPPGSQAAGRGRRHLAPRRRLLASDSLGFESPLCHLLAVTLASCILTLPIYLLGSWRGASSMSCCAGRNWPVPGSRWGLEQLGMMEFVDLSSTGYGVALTLMPVLAYCHLNQPPERQLQSPRPRRTTWLLLKVLWSSERIPSHISRLLPRKPPVGLSFSPKYYSLCPFTSFSFSLPFLFLWPRFCLPSAICEAGQMPPLLFSPAASCRAGWGRPRARGLPSPLPTIPRLDHLLSCS